MDLLSWQHAMEAHISGIERELRSSSRSRTRMALNAFRVRLRARRLVEGHKQFEEQLECFIAENADVRGAAESYLAVATVAAMEQARSALARASKLVPRNKARVKSV